MKRYLVDAAVLARKDLQLELRARDTLPAMLLFVLAALVVFHFALPADASALAERGLLWIAIVFTALLGLARVFAAEREPLHHPAGEGADALVPRAPEAVALEQHSNALAPLGDAIQPAVEVEVLERGQLPVEEGLVTEIAE